MMIQRVWIRTIGDNASMAITDHGKRRVTLPNCSVSARPRPLRSADGPQTTWNATARVSQFCALLLRRSQDRAWKGAAEVFWEEPRPAKTLPAMGYIDSRNLARARDSPRPLLHSFFILASQSDESWQCSFDKLALLRNE